MGRGKALIPALFLCLLAPVAFAHSLLPGQVTAYINQHPEATSEQIEEWINAQETALHMQIPDSAKALVAAAVSPGDFFENALEFVSLGINHIFTGTDHILFLVAVMLTFVSLKEILKLTGTFTLAHSITLILSSVLLVSVSSRIVEPLIAFSIAYVAITTVLIRRADRPPTREKLVTIFLFGLIHGLGFAGALKEVKIPSNMFVASLLFFNVGIEIGQLVIVGFVIVPAVALIRRSRSHAQIIRAIAIAISVIGIVWGIQRLFV